MTPEILEIIGLKVNFCLQGKINQAVDGVSLFIRDHETVVLAGESGSGKTVTALSITGILPPNALIAQGKILYRGQDLLTLGEDALSRIRGNQIAYIFQEPGAYLNPVLTIGDQLSETIILHQGLTKGAAGEEAAELLALVKIRDPKDILRSYPHQLSGGMNQRVFLAMALACKPRMLIADEPTTSLDVTVEAKMLELLMDLKKEIGFALLFITHNLSIAKKIADRIYVMYRGKIVEEGDKDKILTRPEHAHTKELVAAFEKIGKL